MPSKKATPGKKRSREESEQRILRAAEDEFSARGFAGARMEHIADRAGLNKALLYRYFESKEGLFSATLERRFERRYQTIDKVPRNLGEALAFWVGQAARDNRLLRLLQREALNEDQPAVHEDLRRRHYRRQVDIIQTLIDDGQMPGELDPDMLVVALTALVSYPAMFPRQTELMCGLDPTTEDFVQRYQTTLRQLSAALGKAAQKTPPSASSQK